MGKLYEPKFNRFDGGISDNGRELIQNKGQLVQHFDIFSNPYKLIPQRSTETDINDGIGADGMKARDARHFQLGLDGKLYALCKNGSGYAEVCSKADPTTGNWAVEATSASAAARVTGCFIEWQSSWWMFTSTNLVSKWVIGSTFTDNVATLGEAIITTAQGVIGADDNLYMFYNNKVVRVTPAGVATDDVCQAIPSDMRITSACRWGNYLAIACAYGTSATATPSGRSQVFLWNMLTDTTVDDVLDFGEGALQIIGNIEGRIVGVSSESLEKSVAADDLSVGGGSMVVRLWSGGIPKIIKEVKANRVVTLGRFIRDVVIKDNRMYWVASIPFGTSTATESTFKLGIWGFGRKNSASEFALSLEYIEDGIDTSNWKIPSFGNAGNYWFINHSNDGSISKTDDTANYTTTSVYETQVFGNGSNQLKLVGVCLQTEKQPSGGQTIIKYKKDGETTWTTISTNTTDNVLFHKAIKMPNGDNLPHYRELELRFESTGGTIITGYSFKYEKLDVDIYG